jgi:hypothetical protein
LTELYLTRTTKNTEKDLDNIRQSRISNDILILKNLERGVYQYMMIEPQSHQTAGKAA